LAGGAELVNEELAKRLVQDGHRVIFLVGGYKKVESQKLVKFKVEEMRDGYKIIRLGNRWTVYWKAYKYYKKNLIGWADLVIDEVNTIPFFASFYMNDKFVKSKVKSDKVKSDTKSKLSTFNFQLSTSKRPKVVLFVHQLCREIWFYQIFFPLNLIGYLLEPFYLWLLRDKKVITVSESTKKDLLKYGYKKENVKVISEGIQMKPIENLENIEKYSQPTILSLGAIRKMKRTARQIKAFEIAKKQIPNLRFKISGLVSDQYGKKVLRYIQNSKYKKDIEYMGRISNEKKIELMQKSHLICVTSVKEGWGPIVTEANSQGTPAVVYDVDGLRDSVKNNETGLICQKNTPENLAENVINLLSNQDKYDKLRLNAWRWSKEINFERSYDKFVKFIKL